MGNIKGNKSVLAAASYLDDSKSWDAFGLDPRLLQAIDNLGFECPTLIQSSVIPLSLEDKADIIAKASTGSGKTASYILPILQLLLKNKVQKKEVECVILVPTRELANQVTRVIEQCLLYCSNEISVLNISSNVSDQVLFSLLSNKPNILVSTPGRLVQSLEKIKDTLSLASVTKFVIDEVDLVLSYGYLEDLRKLATYLPPKKNMQTFLMSATINDDIDELKSKFCSKPAVLKLTDEVASKQNLLQYYVKTTEFDKFLLAYVIFKLNLIKGKTLIFVNSIDRGFRLRLFLEQFGIRCCMLNSELPINSRLHIVEEFNKNVYNLLIATDETECSTEGDEHEKDEESSSTPNIKQDGSKSLKKSHKKNHKKDREYGVSRGVDFHNVACVLNFDLPKTSNAYIHRIGRTARAGKSGMALSFVLPLSEFGKHKVACLSSAKRDEKILHRIVKQQSKHGFEIKPYRFDMSQVEGFRYRAEDAFRAVTLNAIREARIRELKNEIMNSDKLKRFFEENPKDLVNLRHDKELHAARVQPHLKRVPQYLLPEGARNEVKKISFIPFHKKSVHKKRKPRSKKADPLKSFK